MSVEVIHLDKDNYPKAVAVINELADLENRKPHDSAKILILEEGQKKIDGIKERKNQSSDKVS